MEGEGTEWSAWDTRTLHYQLARDPIKPNYVGSLQELCQQRGWAYPIYTDGVPDYMQSKSKPLDDTEGIKENTYNLFPSGATNHMTGTVCGKPSEFVSQGKPFFTYGRGRGMSSFTQSQTTDKHQSPGRGRGISSFPQSFSNKVNSSISQTTAKHQSSFDTVDDSGSDSEENDELFKSFAGKTDELGKGFNAHETDVTVSLLQNFHIDSDFKVASDVTYPPVPKFSSNDSEKRLETKAVTNGWGKYNITRNLSQSFCDADSEDNDFNCSAFEKNRNNGHQSVLDCEHHTGNVFPEFGMRPASNKEYFWLLKSLASRMHLEVRYEVVSHLTSNSLAQCVVHVDTDPSIICYGSAKSQNKAKYSAARCAFEYLKSTYGKG